MRPLVVDLNGTLISTNILHESVLKAVKIKPSRFFHLPYWASKGRGILKARLAAELQFDPKTLPYNREVIDWLRSQKTAGRYLVLCTATEQGIAQSIADHLDLFDEVTLREPSQNLAGTSKASFLAERYGLGEFDYVGSDKADMAIWETAANAIIVNPSGSLLKRIKRSCSVSKVFTRPSRKITAYSKALRVNQWIKNILIFTPLFAAHDLGNLEAWLMLTLCYASFSLCASTVYIINDLLDLDSDRSHPRKRYRPFAAGDLPARNGVLLIPILLLASISIGAIAGGQFLSVMALYFTLTTAYSFKLKSVVLVDCIALALLYTTRIIAGIVALEHNFSPWFLGFSLFLFLSLSFVKRYAELDGNKSKGIVKLPGRAYLTTDAPLVQMTGIASGYASAIVLALYLNTGTVTTLLAHPIVSWAAVPTLLFWVNWIWLRAHRGEMTDDPVVFAVTDKVSLLAGAVFTCVMLFSATGF